MAKKKIQFWNELIWMLGGPKVVAKYFNVSQACVYNWRHKGVPSKRRVELSRWATESGYRYLTLRYLNEEMKI